ncbi:MAG TPA: carboxypeptidase regulatory-like domain-containing protein [Sedimentisphaerales bacterium]|nr:carboxypeptidase regulatory-like domain-containing protein [Sedimentisphaerales bacterium]
MGDEPNLIIKFVGILIVCGVCSISYAAKPVLVNVQVDVEQEPDKEYVYNILSEIEKRGWSVTVYFTGEFAMGYPNIVKDIHDKRHQIAVCGWTSGEDLTFLSFEEQLEFINISFTTVRSAINNFHYAYIADFRPQGLKQNENTFKALQQLNIRSNTGFLASETKTHPYHTDYDFIAIPVATIKNGSEDVPLIDDVIFNRGANVQDYLAYLTKRYDESLVTKEPFTIVVHSSVTGSDEAKLEAFTQFLDYVKDSNGQVVMTDHMTTLANPYMSDLRLSVPDFAYSGRLAPIRVSYYAHCDCPIYYIRIYGKYPCDFFWQRLDSGQFVDKGASVGPREKFGLIPIPYSYCNDPNYMLMAVGRACHGVCWPTYNSYEDVNEVKLRLKNPEAGKWINGVVRTDVPGVDKYCPRGGECVELKPGDLVFNSPGLFYKPMLPLGHVGIYIGDGYVVESVPFIFSFQFSGVRSDLIDSFAYNFFGRWRGATTVFGFKKLCPCTEEEWRKRVVDEALSYRGTRYAYPTDLQCYNRNPKRGQTLQCAQLVYLAYKSIDDYDLRASWGPIWPWDIYKKTSGAISGSGVLGHDSYSKLVDPPPIEFWPQPIIRKIYPDGVFSEEVLVDPTISSIVFTLDWEHTSSNLHLTIYDPNGAVVSDPNIIYQRDEQLGGEYYIIDNPRTGNWTTQVTAVNVPEDGEDYTLSNYFASNLTVIPALEKLLYSPGEDVRVSANLTDSDLPISDVNMTAEVYKPDGSSSSVSLFDDGSHGDIQPNDDIYSGLFTETSIEGTYNIKISANGIVSNSRFDRESYESFYIREQTAQLIYWSDNGVDSSGDGLWDLLAMQVYVYIIDPGHYRLTGTLCDQNQAFIDRLSTETYLDPGFHTVELNFDGMAICEHGVNGPYRVDVGIYDANGIQMDYLEGYSTEPYDYTDFQRGGQITGIVTDTKARPIENAYLQVSKLGDTIFYDDFNDSWLSSDWSKWPNIPDFSIDETNGELKIDVINTEAGWNELRYKPTVNQNVEASIRVRTPIFREGTSFSFIIWKGGPGSYYGGPEWGCYRISRYSDGYTVLGHFQGQDYWDCGSLVGLFGDEKQNFHTLKIIYEKSNKQMSFFVDDICICNIGDADFVDFQFGFTAESRETRPDIDVRVDDFLVKEFAGFTPDIEGTASTDPNGVYEIDRLLPATYEISVLPPEGANLLRDSDVVVLGDKEKKMVNFILEEGGAVSGHVCDSNGVSVSGAYLEASGPEYATAITDANGIYKLTGLESETYDLSVIPSPNANLMEAKATVQAVTGETKIMDFTLQPAGSIAGRITDANGTPIRNVYLFLSGFETPRYSVDEDGRYVIPGLYAGTYTINTDAVETEFLDDSKTVNVRLGQTTNADFVLQKGRIFVKISGYVKNTAGEPLSDAPVWIENTQNDMGWIDTTNEDGYFEFTNFSDGLYEIAINDEWPKLFEYTAIGFKDDKLVNVTEDLVMYFTLQRVEVDVAVDTRMYTNGDTIDVEITATNNDVQDLVNWSAFVELKNNEDEVLDFNSTPINVAVGDTSSVTVTLRIPEDNISPNLNLDVEIRENLFVSSNIKPLNAITYQEVWLDGIIQVREQTERYEEDFETGDFSRFNLILSGDASWTITSAEKFSGSYSTQTGEIDDNENTSISVTLDCSSGDITFYLNVSSEYRFDFLEFYIDGNKKDEWSGQVDWTQVSFPVTAGTRTFKWVYEKDLMISEGSDTAWIDDIVFPILGYP